MADLPGCGSGWAEAWRFPPLGRGFPLAAIFSTDRLRLCEANSWVKRGSGSLGLLRAGVSRLEIGRNRDRNWCWDGSPAGRCRISRGLHQAADAGFSQLAGGIGRTKACRGTGSGGRIAISCK